MSTNGAPPGSIGDSPYAQPFTVPQFIEEIDKQAGAPNKIVQNDPAFPPPFDPVTQANTKTGAKLIYRELPLVTIQNTWSVPGARAALYQHVSGIFEQSNQLWESIIGDDRVMATLGSRTTGLFGREVRFRPADDSDAAKEVLDAWQQCWPLLSGTPALREMNNYTIGMGFQHAQLVWDTAKPVWCPYVKPWSSRYMYFHWGLRRFVALTLDGPMPIMPGDGKWVSHMMTEYRPWLAGAIRAVAEPWMLRHFAYRDMARYSEIHGLPTRVGKVPAVSDPAERAAFEAAIANLGSDTSMIIPQGVDGQDGSGYEYCLVEARDRAWEVFGGMIEKCDTSIVLALLFQNLTTEVQGGSYAAASAHMDIRQSGLQGDNALWRATIYNQIARPFAYFNFGDADLAPWTDWDVAPRDDLKGNADQFQKFAAAMQALSTAGLTFANADELRAFAEERFGLMKLPSFKVEKPEKPAAPGAPPGEPTGGDSAAAAQDQKA